jgi:hypothetical protein
MLLKRRSLLLQLMRESRFLTSPLTQSDTDTLSPCPTSLANLPPPPRLIETACSVLDNTEAVEDCETQREAEDPIAFAASKSDPDTMHCGEAMRAADTK